MTSATIYARVPVQTKDAAEAYATAHGSTLAAAMHELLSLGLVADQNAASTEAMQTRISELEQRLRDTELTLREQSFERERAEHELAAMRQAAEVWAKRADLIVGACPSCKNTITGGDLLVSGRCPSCARSTTALMEPKTSALNSNDFMLALGGVGLLLGILAVAGRAQ